MALSLVGVIATLWLGAAGQLTLYIHPRYVGFTVILAILGGAIVIVATAVNIVGRSDDPGTADHDHDAPTRARPRIVTAGRLMVLGFAVICMLALPPASLTATTRENRDLVTSGQTLDRTDTTVLAGGDSTTFSLGDWAALLSQGGPDAVVGQPLKVSGYIVDQGDDDIFVVARLMVSCCAVDAQPIGVPVYLPGWRDTLSTNGWVEIAGSFVAHPAADLDHPTVIRTTSITKIDEPDQPYVF